MSHQPVPVVLYTQTGCAASRQVRAWLTEHNVVFTERNVTGDYDLAKELYATGIFATPLLVVGDAKVIGFRPESLTAALSSLPREESTN